MPEGTGAAGINVCSSGPGGQRPGSWADWGGKRSRKKPSLESSLTGGAGCHGGKAPLLLRRALLPTSIWLVSAGRRRPFSLGLHLDS